MDYWKLVKRAWYITGKYKFLWIFGLFLGNISISSSGFNGNYSNKINSSSIDFLDKGQELFFANLVLIGITVFIVVGALLVMIFLKTISYSSIITGVNEVEKTGESNFSKSFKFGLKYFWKILALQILSTLIIFIALVVLGLPVIILFVLEMPLRGFLLGLLAFIIFLPLAVIINYTSTYTSRSIVIDKSKLFQAIKNGFDIFKNNILTTFFISLILFTINMGVTIIVIIALLCLGLLFGIPIAIIGFVINAGVGVIGGILMVILGILIIGIFFIFIDAILNTFQSTLWTLTYRKLK